jgi:hypothetical protein
VAGSEATSFFAPPAKRMTYSQPLAIAGAADRRLLDELARHVAS